MEQHPGNARTNSDKIPGLTRCQTHLFKAARIAYKKPIHTPCTALLDSWSLKKDDFNAFVDKFAVQFSR